MMIKKFEDLPGGALFTYSVLGTEGLNKSRKTGTDSWTTTRQGSVPFSHTDWKSKTRVILWSNVVYPPKQGVSMNNVLSELKSYFTAHRDLLFTILLIVLLDHFLFEGAFRARLKSYVENFLGKQEEKLNAIDTVKVN